MTAWAKLTEQQQSFIRKYLVKGGLFGADPNSEANQKIIENFADFEKLRDGVDAWLEQLPADYTVMRERVVALLNAGQFASDQGDFGEAAAAARNALRLTGHISDHLQKTILGLQNDVAPDGGPTGFSNHDQQIMNEHAAALTGRIGNWQPGDPFPSKADVTASQQARNDYLNAWFEAHEAIDDEGAADAFLARAWTMHGAFLRETAGLNHPQLQNTPQYAQLTQLIAQADQLVHGYDTHDTQDWKARRDLAGNIMKYGAARAVDEVLSQAIRAFAAEIAAIYEPAKAAIRRGAHVDLDLYPNGPNLAQMEDLKRRLGLNVISIESTLATSTIDHIEGLRTQIATAAGLANDMADHIKAAELLLLEEDLTAKQGSAPHIARLVSLKDQDPDTAQKVIDMITANAVALGGKMASTDLVGDLKQDQRTQQGELTALKKKLEEDGNTYEEKFTKLQQLKKDMSGTGGFLGFFKTYEGNKKQKTQEYEALKEDVKELYDAWYALKDDIAEKKSDLAETKKKVEVAERQRALLNALTFGPLSENPRYPMPAGKQPELVDLYCRHPKLGEQVCRTAPLAKDPDSFIDTAIFLGAQLDQNFALPTDHSKCLSPEDSAAYASTLLERAAYLGKDYAKDAQTAIGIGWHLYENPVVSRDKNAKENAGARARQAAETMLASGTVPGTVAIDVNSISFKQVIAAQKFSGTGQVTPSTIMNVEMEKFADWMQETTPTPPATITKKEQAEACLNAVTVPTDPKAISVLSKLTGLSAADIQDPTKADAVKKEMQTAILKAMVTPVAQGKVGSCFATSGVLKLKKDDPIRLMELYSDILTKGTFTTNQNLDVPAVVNLQPEDDQLSRSLEYTVAQASARLNFSITKRVNDAVVFSDLPARGTDPATTAPFNQLAAAITHGTDPTQLKDWLRREIFENQAFVYDPTKGVETAADESSDRGAMIPVDKETEQPIDTDAKFADFLVKQLDNIFAYGDPKLVAADLPALKAAVRDQAFLDAVAGRPGKPKPWDDIGGGHGDETNEVLHGAATSTHSQSKDMVAEDKTASTTKRAKDIMKALAGTTPGDVRMISSDGAAHTFTSLPTDPRLLPDPPGIDANIDSVLMGPGQTIKNTVIPVEECVFMFEREIGRMSNYPGDKNITENIRGKMKNVPTIPMTPLQLQQYIQNELSESTDARADARTEAWKKREEKRPGVKLVQKDIDDQRNKEKIRIEKGNQSALSAQLAEDFAAPQVKIADSNWGDETNHRDFVIAPDPITGDLKLWSKAVIGGKMTMLPDDWLKQTWNWDD